MILRRITAHVRAQNWTAIAIDFFIVVFGVFLGAQIGAWSETRQQHTLYEEAFDRAIAETHRNLEGLQATRRLIDERLPVVQTALEDLRACHTGEAARQRVEAAFAPLGGTISFRIETGALDQLIGNEGFQRFQTPEVRAQLMDLAALLHGLSQNSRSQYDQMVAGQVDLSGTVDRGALTFQGIDQIVEAIRGGAAPSPELVRPSELSVPLSQACRDQRLLTAFYDWEGIATYHGVMVGLSEGRLRDALAALGHPSPASAGPIAQ